MCPAALPRDASGGLLSAAQGGNASYLLNGVADGKPLAALPTPAGTILLHELAAASRASQVRPLHLPFADGGAKPWTAEWRAFAHPLYDDLHAGGANALFADGHARAYLRNALTYAMFGCPPERNPGLPTNLPTDDAEALRRYEADRYASEF